MSGTGTTDANGGLDHRRPRGGRPGVPRPAHAQQRRRRHPGRLLLSYGLYLSSGATFDNEPGASFAFVTDASIQSDGGTPAGGTFVNEGTLSKTGGTGTSTIGGGVTLTDTGTIEADTGTLSLQGGGSLGGTFTSPPPSVWTRATSSWKTA